MRLISSRPPLVVLGESTSDGVGVFSFAHLPVGILKVVADHGADGFVGSAPLRVSDGEVTEVTLVLSATRGVRGSVVDVEAHPIAGATLQIEGPPWRVPSATSEDGGTFHLTVVPDEATTLVASARGYATAHIPLGPREDGELILRVQLAAAPPVRGLVYGVDGDGVPAEVIACAGQPLEAHARSADDGSFQLPGSTLGCEAVAEQSSGASSEPVVLAEGRPILRLKLPGGIEGTVVDERGAPVSSFSVGIESYSGARGKQGGVGGAHRFEDQGGAFRLEKLAPGSYVLTASAAGKPPTRSESVEVAIQLQSPPMEPWQCQSASSSPDSVPVGVPIRRLELGQSTCSSTEPKLCQNPIC